MHSWNLAGIGSCIAMTLFVSVMVWMNPRIQRWAEKPEPAAPVRSNAIDSSNYKVPDHALHVIDLERSEFYVQPSGSVIARCAVQGCPMTAVLGRNVANAIIVEEPKES